VPGDFAGGLRKRFNKRLKWLRFRHELIVRQRREISGKELGGKEWTAQADEKISRNAIGDRVFKVSSGHKSKYSILLLT